MPSFIIIGKWLAKEINWFLGILVGSKCRKHLGCYASDSDLID
jgi:hypothetical protein